MDLEMKPTQSFEDRPRSFSLTAAACVFILLLAYVFSCVSGLEGAGPRRPASRQIPFQLPISTPEEQGLDADMLAAAYERATEIPRIYSMLVVRNGRLVAEEYFDAQTRTTPMPVASVCKSIVGALVGIALDEGYLVSLDQRMIDFFPEYDVPGLDRRKRDITIRHLLQMRAGFPSDSTIEFFNLLTNSRDWFQLIIVDWPLERSPGTGWVAESLEDYSATSWDDYGTYRNIRYGNLWWYAEVDGHEIHFAWGHGGQFITVVPTLDLVVVTTADNFLGDFTNNSWNTEGAIFRMVARDVIPAAY